MKVNLLEGYPKQAKVLSLIAMFILAGFSFMWPLTSIYVTSILGKSLATAGWVLAAEGIAGVIGSFIGGIFFDRFGGKLIMIAASSIVILSNIILAISKDWIVFLTCFMLMNFAVGVLMTSISALAGIIWPEGGKKPYNLNYVFQNIGVAFGTALGGFVSSVSFSYSFITNAFFFFLATILIIFTLKDVKKKRDKISTINSSPYYMLKSSKRTLWTISFLGLGASFTMMAYIQWQSSIPIYMKHLGISLSSYSFLWTLNGILVILLQPLTAFISKKFPATRMQFLLGQLCLIVSFGLIILNQSYSIFILSMGLVTLGEMIIWPLIPAFASTVSPPGCLGVIQGIISIFNYGGRLLGPILGTLLYEGNGPYTMVAVMLVFYLVALINFLISIKISESKTNLIPVQTVKQV